MKKLQSLLNELRDELEKEMDDGSDSHLAGGTMVSSRRFVVVKERLKPIVDSLLEHQRVLESADQDRAEELELTRGITQFQAAELHAVIESLPDAVLIATKEGVALCNPAALKMLGIESLEDLPDEARRGSPFRYRWAGTRKPLLPEESPLARALQGEAVAHDLIHTDPRTGEERIHRCSAAPVLLDGDVLGAVAVGTDITDMEMARIEVEALNTNLDQLVQDRTRELTQAKEALERALGEVEALKERLEAENSYLHFENDRRYNFGDVVGRSGSLKEVFHSIDAVAPQDTTVLLLGETGTGKSTLARAIHARSARKDRPMVVVNCTSLPGSLIESELFGREKGAFTGANAQQIGRFELADKGTIFLDEIGDLPWELQAKLLHVLQEKEFCRLGSPQVIKVDVRIIAATNHDLKEDMANGRFREDLYYRLSTFPVVIPPLRQRPEDIPLLVEAAIRKFCQETGKKIEHISAGTMNRLVNHSWPGNVRELENVIERAVIISQGPTLQVMDTFEALPQEPAPGEVPLGTLAEVERAHIIQCLRQTQGRIDGKNGAALILGMNPSTLRGRMRKEGIQRFEWM